MEIIGGNGPAVDEATIKMVWYLNRYRNEKGV